MSGTNTGRTGRKRGVDGKSHKCGKKSGRTGRKGFKILTSSLIDASPETLSQVVESPRKKGKGEIKAR